MKDKLFVTNMKMIFWKYNMEWNFFMSSNLDQRMLYFSHHHRCQSCRGQQPHRHPLVWDTRSCPRPGRPCHRRSCAASCCSSPTWRGSGMACLGRLHPMSWKAGLRKCMRESFAQHPAMHCQWVQGQQSWQQSWQGRGQGPTLSTWDLEGFLLTLERPGYHPCTKVWQHCHRFLLQFPGLSVGM